MARFKNLDSSHQHSKAVMTLIDQHEEFMDSIETMADFGCGAGIDLQWWANLEDHGDVPKPRNLQCYGVDITDQHWGIEHERITFIQGDFEKRLLPRKVDVIWCHDAFQYATNPLNTLRLWNEQINTNGMLYICVPMHINNVQGRWSMEAWNQEYFSWTPLSLIYALAVNGFDMRDAYMYKAPSDPWLHAVVFKSNLEPMDPKTTTWHDLSSAGLLHDTVMASIQTFGRPVQNHIVYPWLDHENHYFSA